MDWRYTRYIVSTNNSANGAAHNSYTQKGKLFCTSCSYSSRYDGGWTTVEADGTLHYLCPCCGTEITTRTADTTPHSQTARVPAVGGEKR
ncbi:small CPxCG-related zinc finger protein [Natronomonas pharaonis DSM 2160]|uniref:Small CPxCG-related zinc finger protein n=1 Tax=Natronomonas pharaonis (strain ATCC 35678 / DSM 2160 / CIP 103997 / JCM 8858 / NBRC 14720 / NCIMB 2260 / Gabara) TaxID=348780 RepID=A0A1U7EZR7_NATPD|nr:small CPxCG-related zinc finger protein [Natronomonas pharaonis DSM 2160]